VLATIEVKKRVSPEHVAEAERIAAHWNHKMIVCIIGNAEEKDFHEWIKAKKRAYFDKTFNIHPNCTDFMELVENYYKDACTAGEGMQPDDEQHTILALKAEISQMKVRSKNKRQHEKFKGKTYYWWYKHKQWTIHKPEECCLKGKKADEDRRIKKEKGKKHALKMRVYEAALQDKVTVMTKKVTAIVTVRNPNNP
jgi:hypothetical protein